MLWYVPNKYTCAHTCQPTADHVFPYTTRSQSFDRLSNHLSDAAHVALETLYEKVRYVYPQLFKGDEIIMVLNSNASQVGEVLLLVVPS